MPVPPAPAVGLGVQLRARSLRYPATAIDGAWGLHDISLTLAPGEWTCVLGPSGVGKSTVLRYLAGLLPDSEAEVETSDGRALRGRVAYMAQDDLLLPWLDVLGNVTLGARLRGERPDTAAALAMLEAVGLIESARTLPATLSGGMRQRAALARTLLEPAELVLMDEPFSALDALTRYRLQALAASLLRERTVLLITHDPNEALRLGDRIHVLGGEPARLGAPCVPATPPLREPTDASVKAELPGLLASLGMRAIA